MKFHKQTELYIKGISRGNCYPTTLACLLDLEINQVPNFHLMYWSNEERDLHDQYIRSKFPPSQNKDKNDLANENFWNWKTIYDNLWEFTRDAWLASKGLKESVIQDIDQWLKDHPGELYMACGQSPRDVSHVVIYKDGEMYHDVHPDGDGLIKLWDTPYSFLEKI